MIIFLKSYSKSNYRCHIHHHLEEDHHHLEEYQSDKDTDHLFTLILHVVHLIIFKVLQVVYHEEQLHMDIPLEVFQETEDHQEIK